MPVTAAPRWRTAPPTMRSLTCAATTVTVGLWSSSARRTPHCPWCARHAASHAAKASMSRTTVHCGSAGGVLVDSEQVDGALLGVDFDVGAVGDARGGRVGADHRREAELAGHDRGVAQRSAFFHDEGADDG